MIYLKIITRKLNKYIKNKNERKYKKLETMILKHFKKCWKLLKKSIYGIIKQTFRLIEKVKN